jgi:PAS domain S-box-containing protein
MPQYPSLVGASGSSSNAAAMAEPSMKALLEAHDWNRTSLGPMNAWPVSLRVLVKTLLDCRLPMYMAWGPEHIQFYNDAYRPILGAKHPHALGQSANKTWSEIWDTIGLMWEEVWQGKTFGFDDFKLTIERFGYPEDCYFNFSYSPIPDDAGEIAGVMVTFAETTQKVLNEKRQAFQLLLSDSLRNLGEPQSVLAKASRLIGMHLQVSRVGYGEIDSQLSTVTVDKDWTIGGSVSLAGTRWTLQDFGAEIVDDLLAGKTVIVHNMESDARTVHHAAAYAQIASKAVLCVPLIKEGKLSAFLYLHEPYPRHWLREEVELVEEVAERTWDAVNRAKAEQLRNQQAEEFLTLTQIMPQQAWMADAGGQTIWCNQRVFDYTGIAPSELTGKSWIGALHPDDVAATSQKWFDCINKAMPYEAEFRIRDGQGGYRWFISRALPVCDASGKPVRWVGTNTDVHEQKKNVAALTQLNTSLEAEVAKRTADRDRMWRLSTDIMLVAGFNAEIVATNPAWQEILGWEEAELLGRNFLDYVHPEDRERTVAECAHLASGMRTERFENRYRHRNGAYRWLSWIAVPDASYIHAVGRDVTEDKQQLDALRQTESALRQSQKMEAVGQLTGGLAHDFNNLLAGIGANLEMLKFRLSQGQTDKLENYLIKAGETVDRAAALTHRLLSFSRRQALAPQAIAPNDLIISMEDLIRRTIGPSIAVDLRFSPDLWAIRCDQNQLENTLLNLVINARDAMPDGGLLSIETSNCTEDETGRPGVSPTAPGEYVFICVRDTGIGMSPAVAARAFDPFFTTKPLGQGTGLGLSMVYGFVTQSGGQIYIDSKVGRGTAVCIYLPRHRGRIDRSEKEESAHAYRVADKRANILLVDDEEGLRQTLAEMLTAIGYHVMESSSGAEALQVIQRADHIDLLVTDVGLPGGMNGRQLADVARQLKPDLQVLFITGYAESVSIRAGDLAEKMYLMTKPFSLGDFTNRIGALLKSSR